VLLSCLPWSGDPKTVAVGIAEVALTAGQSLFVNRNAEFVRDGVYVIDVEMNQRARPCIACMFGQVEANRAAGD